MIYIKKIFPLFVWLILISSCTKDDLDPQTIIDQISAPENVGAIFSIAQDNSGLLSLTPNAQGATLFNIYWEGSDTETPTEVTPGSSAQHAYGEGEFTLKVVAIGITGLTGEYTTPVTISFSPPENLVVDITKDMLLGATVSPSADGATLFHVFFGDVSDEEPTIIMPGESAFHVYPEAGDYTVMVTALGAGAATAEFSELITIDPIPDEPVELPITFETSAGIVFGDFGNAFGSVEDNPDPSGINTSSRVGKIFKSAGANTWAGVTLELTGTNDLSTGNMFKMKVWSPKVGAIVKFKFENEDVSVEYEVDAVTTTSNAWEELTYDFTDAPQGDYKRLVVFFDFDVEGDDTDYYFDDIELFGEGDEILTLPLTMESSTLDYDFASFGNIAPIEIINNPDPSGINTTGKVAQLVKTAGAETWAGCTLDLDELIDLSASQMFTMKVWSPQAGVVIKFKIENEDASITEEVDVTTTMSNAWEELSYDFSAAAAADYIRVVVFCDFGNMGDDAIYYFDDIDLPGGSSGADFVLEDFESNTIVFTDFGNIGDTEVVDNPDVSGLNTSTKVAQLTKTSGAEIWGGSFFEPDASLNLNDYSKIKVKTWSPQSGITIKAKVENEDASITHEVDLVNTSASAWEELIYDFSDAPAADYVRLVIFFDFGVNGDDSVYYFDDYILGN